MKTIFIVDDNNVNLLTADEALSVHYRVFTMPSASSMFELLEDIKPDIILLDILMPEMNGFEALRMLKVNKRLSDIPVVFLTSRNDASTETLGFEMGAVDFISKPFSQPVLLNRIRAHLDMEDIIRERTDAVVKLKDSIVSVLANFAEYRNMAAGNHIERTTKYVGLLLDGMCQRKVYTDEIGEWDLDMVIASSRLHDIGKIAVKGIILNKPGKLSDDEFAIVKTHASEGEKIINSIIAQAGNTAFLQYAKLFAGYHHERMDGDGYPYRLKGLAIPLLGRIMAIVDVYDALVSDRPYKIKCSHSRAIATIKENSGTQFDPDLVDVFLSCEKNFDNVSREN